MSKEQRRVALRYAKTILADLHHEDLRELEVAVEMGESGSVYVAIQAAVLPGHSSDRVIDTTSQFMHRRSGFTRVDPVGIQEG